MVSFNYFIPNSFQNENQIKSVWINLVKIELRHLIGGHHETITSIKTSGFASEAT
jgi:hypothetical protein